MTAEEAIKEFKERIELGKKEYLKDIPEYIEALEMAIEALEKVEQYKRLEEQGLLLSLPVKVGDMVYVIEDSKRINPMEIETICVGDSHISMWHVWHKFDLDDLGKTVFLTREEAEQKLKEMEGNA